MTVDVATDRAQLAGTTISGSDWVTIDGGSGNIYLGRRDTVETRPETELAEIAGWRSQPADRAHDGHKPQSPRHQVRHGTAGA